MKKIENIKNNKNSNIMKAKNLLRIALIAMISVFYLTGTNAQTLHPTTLTLTAGQTVNLNSIYHYGVDSTERAGVSNIYAWTVTPGVNTVDYVILPGTNSATKRIQWLTANTYTIQLTETNPVANGGCGSGAASPTLIVIVSPAPTGTVGFASLTGTNQCSASPAAIYSANLTTTGTVSYPITVNVTYTINGATSAGTITVANLGDALDIPASVAFSSSATDDAVRRVTLNSITDSFGGTIGLGANTTHTLTIWARPATSTIHHD
jgi:hypothetical protein